MPVELLLFLDEELIRVLAHGDEAHDDGAHGDEVHEGDGRDVVNAKNWKLITKKINQIIYNKYELTRSPILHVLLNRSVEIWFHNEWTK